MRWYIKCARSGEHRRVDRYPYMRKYLKDFDNTESGGSAYIDSIDMNKLQKHAYWEYKSQQFKWKVQGGQNIPSLPDEVYKDDKAVIATMIIKDRDDIKNIKQRNNAKPILKLFFDGMTNHTITVRVINITAVKQFNESKSVKLLLDDQEYE